jgi:hypothetical protein
MLPVGPRVTLLEFDISNYLSQEQRAGQIWAMFRGSITYEDMFGDQHETEAVYSYQTSDKSAPLQQIHLGPAALPKLGHYRDVGEMDRNTELLLSLSAKYLQERHVAHAFSKPFIFLTQDPTDKAPVDVRQFAIHPDKRPPRPPGYGTSGRLIDCG